MESRRFGDKGDERKHEEGRSDGFHDYCSTKKKQMEENTIAAFSWCTKHAMHNLKVAGLLLFKRKKVLVVAVLLLQKLKRHQFLLIPAAVLVFIPFFQMEPADHIVHSFEKCCFMNMSINTIFSQAQSRLQIVLCMFKFPEVRSVRRRRRNEQSTKVYSSFLAPSLTPL